MADKSVHMFDVVAEFNSLKDARTFIDEFESKLEFATICRCVFREYPKFEKAYRINWVILVDDWQEARKSLKKLFGENWADAGGGDIVWNARDGSRTPFWAIIFAPNIFSEKEARSMERGPVFETAQGFISVSTSGEITGIYPPTKDESDQ